MQGSSHLPWLLVMALHPVHLLIKAPARSSGKNKFHRHPGVSILPPAFVVNIWQRSGHLRTSSLGPVTKLDGDTNGGKVTFLCPLAAESMWRLKRALFLDRSWAERAAFIHLCLTNPFPHSYVSFTQPLIHAFHPSWTEQLSMLHAPRYPEAFTDPPLLV